MLIFFPRIFMNASGQKMKTMCGMKWHPMRYNSLWPHKYVQKLLEILWCWSWTILSHLNGRPRGEVAKFVNWTISWNGDFRSDNKIKEIQLRNLTLFLHYCVHYMHCTISVELMCGIEYIMQGKYNGMQEGDCVQ